MKSSPYGSYKLGYTRATMVITKGYIIEQSGINLKKLPCSDFGLQFVQMKLESQVIVD